MKRYLNIMYHILFWIVIALFFTHYSFLRPLTINALYKEIVSALLIALMAYINYLYLIPRYFQSGRLTLYWLLTILSILLVGLGEFFLIKPDVYQCLAHSMSTDIMTSFLQSILILIIVRDFCFFLFFFLLKLYRDLSEKYIREKQAISEETHAMFIISPNTGIAQEVKISEIAYVSQERNYTHFHLVSGEVLRQYSSLSKVEQTFPKGVCLRISKNTLVVLPQIIGCDETTVRLSLTEDSITLPISQRYEAGVMVALQNYAMHSANIRPDYQEASLKKCGVKTWSNDDNRGVITKKEDDFHTGKSKKMTDSSSINIHYTADKILLFIKEHPGNRVPAIAEEVNQSCRTVEDHIKNLKKLNLIVYKGASRNGGYFAVKQEKGGF